MSGQYQSPTITPERIREIEKNIRRATTEWLFGLEPQAQILTRALFVALPYTDKLTSTKLLTQPTIMFIGGTGLGKTDLIESISMAIRALSKRIQGTPDLMPYHILGSAKMIENENGGRSVVFDPGKIFCNLLKIDEGNRMRGQTKSALLEGMEERSVTAPLDYRNSQGEKVDALPLFPLSGDLNDIEGPRFFMPLITQNVFGEEEGTYEDPMAQLDRITLTIHMRRPSFEDEIKISAKNVINKRIQPVSDLHEILAGAYYIFDNVEFSDPAKQYRVRLLRNTDPNVVGECGNTKLISFVKQNILVGATPRVNFHLEAVARTWAFFEDSDVVMPKHVKDASLQVIPHRLKLRPEKEFQIELISGEKKRPNNPREAVEIVFNEIVRETDISSWK